jgi:hypothetical protein
MDRPFDSRLGTIHYARDSGIGSAASPHLEGLIVSGALRRRAVHALA